MNELVIGRIYRFKDGRLFRIFRKMGLRYYAGRGCTTLTATPCNFLEARDAQLPSLWEINRFLEEEMANGMAQTINR